MTDTPRSTDLVRCEDIDTAEQFDVPGTDDGFSVGDGILYGGTTYEVVPPPGLATTSGWLQVGTWSTPFYVKKVTEGGRT